MIRKKIVTLIVVFLGIGLCYGFVGKIFSGPRQAASGKLHQSRLHLRQIQALLVSKQILDRKWIEKQGFFKSNLGSQDAFNAWVGQFSAYSQEQRLVFEKIEPLGIKEKDGEKQMQLFLAFQGDIRVLVRFIYFLLEKDPLTSFLSLELRQEDSSAGLMTYQIILAKPFSDNTSNQ